MEDIIQFLVVIGALFIGFALQSKKKKKQMPEEAFPPIFDYEEEEQEEKADHPTDSYTSSTYQPVSMTQETSVAQAIRRSQASSPKSPIQRGAQVTASEKNATRINLRSPQKAREAFIHSEIFTRKYQ